MLKFLLSTIFACVCIFTLSSCTGLSESFQENLYSYMLNIGNPSVKLSFKKGDVLQWDTGVGKGTMKVLSVNEGKFTLEQYNELNKSAKEVAMTGEIFEDGSCKIENPEWNEVWTGDLNGNSMVGKINNIRNFKITWKIPSYLSSSVVAASRLPFSEGDVLKWNLGTTTGTMKVLSIKDDKFSLEKSSDFDKKARPVKMDGTINSDGACCIKSASSKEVWSGMLVGSAITGKANNGYNFKISRSNSVWDMPFKEGGTLTWSVSYRKGTIKVVSVSSTGKFVFDLYKSNSKYLKEARLNGEILGDGTYKFIDAESKETWIGRRSGSEITGKVNNDSKFKIGGLK